MTKLLKYVEPVRANNGKIYFYFRRKGKRTPLPGAYNSPEFLETYWALRNGNAAKLEIAVKRTLPGCIHSIILSARAMRVGGILILSLLAVFWLMISSNVVGCCIGRSEGLAPFKILSI